MAQVLEELQWDNLLSSEWRCLQAIRDLLQPFAVFTALVQGEDFTTASCVIPAKMDLSIHLHELQQNPDVVEATQVLLHELKKQFKNITDQGDSDREPLFLVAIALGPRYKLLR